MRLTDPNASRVQPNAQVMFRTILGPLAVGTVYMREGERVCIRYGEGNDAAMYLEDIIGVTRDAPCSSPAKSKDKP